MRELIVGLDVGNHQTKVVFSEPAGEDKSKKTVKIPSMLTTDGVSNHTFDKLETFEIGKGNSHQLPYTCWSPSELYKRWQLVIAEDNGRGKPLYALPLLISAMWEHLQDGDCMKVVASVHDLAAFEKPIKESLNGLWVVNYRDSDDRVQSKTICVEVLRVLFESAGVVLGQEDRPKQSVVLDIGGGTALVSPLDRARLVLDDVLEFPDSGVKSLIGKLSTNSELKAAIRGDDKLARHYSQLMSNEGLLAMLRGKGKFKYAGGSLDVKEVVVPVVQEWLQALHAELRQSEAVPYLRDPARTNLLTGGGANLPGVARWAKQLGFTVVDDPEFANATGLYSYALSNRKETIHA